MAETKVLTIAEDKLVQIGRLLVGAAFADGDYHDLEEEKIVSILGDFIHDEATAGRVAGKVDQFDAESFEVGEAVAELGDLNETDTNLVLSMVGEVIDADFTYDFSESDYMKEVADALGADPDSYADETVELVEE